MEELKIRQYQAKKEEDREAFIGTDTSTGSKVFIRRHYDLSCSDAEIEILKTINHKNILTPLDIIKEDTCSYVIYPYCEFITLACYINQKDKLTEEEAKELIIQLVNGYEELLKNGLLHGNLEPTSLIITFPGYPLLRLTNINTTDKLTKSLISTQYQFYDVCDIGQVSYYMLHRRMHDNSADVENENSMREDLSEWCKDFLRGCLEDDMNMSFMFFEIKRHPFLTGIAPATRKIPKDNITNELTQSKPSIKFFQDDPYVCNCDRSEDTVFECGHSFCVPCVANMRWKSTLKENIVKQKHKKETLSIFIMCPRCLAYTKIKSIKLPCSCLFDKNHKVEHWVILKKIDYQNYKSVCKRHGKELTVTELWALYGEVKLSLRKLPLSLDDMEKVLAGIGDNVITHLDLKDSNLRSSTESLASILEKNTSIRYLNVSSTDIWQDELMQLISTIYKGKQKVSIKARNSTLHGCGGQMLAMVMNSAHRIDVEKRSNPNLTFTKIEENIMRYNQTLECLDVSICDMSSRNAIPIIQTLKYQEVMKEINFTKNYFGHHGNSFDEFTDSDKFILEQVLASALEHNYTMKVLILSDCCIDSIGAQALSGLFRRTKVLEKVDLSCNEIKDEGVEQLAHSLKRNKTLVNLNLAFNEFHDKGAKDIAKALEFNVTLVELDLGYNKIGNEGARALGEALKINHTLTFLRLNGCDIGNRGAAELAFGLKQNLALKTLLLQDNVIESKGAQVLSSMIRYNKALSKLLLGLNKIPLEGVNAILGALSVNTTLKKIDLEGNLKLYQRRLEFYTTKGCHLTLLNLGNNKLGVENLKTIIKLIKNNKTLTTLNLKGNNIKSKEAEELLLAIKEHPLLKKLNLSNNEFGERGLEVIVPLINECKTLRTLAIGGNTKTIRGAKALALLIKENKTIVKLTLKSNNFDSEDCLNTIILKLRHNNTLSVLNIKDNKMSLSTAKKVFIALDLNQTLSRLYTDKLHIVPSTYSSNRDWRFPQGLNPLNYSNRIIICD